MGRLRARLNRLESNAHATMGQAQFTLRAIEEAAMGLLEELEDGVTLELIIGGKAMPVKLRILPREVEDETTAQKGA